MRGDEIVEIEHLVDHRRQQAISRHLVDVGKGTFHGFVIGLDAQLRTAGEIQHAMTEELQVFLECGTGRESGVIATVVAVQNQLAAWCGDVASTIASQARRTRAQRLSRSIA